MDNVVAAPTGNSEEHEEFDDGIPLDIPSDEKPVGLDNEDSSGLDIGIDLDNLGASAADDDDLVDWDFPGLVVAQPGTAPSETDDTGPSDFDPTIGLLNLETDQGDDHSLGFDASETLINTEFSELGRDEADQDLPDDFQLDLPEEARVGDAPRFWQEVLVEAGRYECLLVTEDAVLAGGEQLLVLGRGRERRLLHTESAIVSMKCTGCEPCAVVATTLSGALLALDAPYPAEARVLAAPDARGPWGNIAGIASFPASDAGIDLVARDAQGNLLLFDANTKTFSKLVLPHAVSQLPTLADCAVALGHDHGGARFLRAETAGSTWTSQRIAPQVSLQLESGPLEFAVHGDCVVLCGSHQGLSISSDRGLSFVKVPGSAAATAVTLGQFRGASTVWLAQSHEVSCRVDLLMLDVESLWLEKIAECPAECSGEFAPAAALVFDEASGRLFVAGDFGVRAYEPPPKVNS